MGKRSVAGLIALFFVFGLLVCADGLLGRFGYREPLCISLLLGLVTLYMATVSFREQLPSSRGDWLIALLFTAMPMLATAVMVLPFTQIPFGWVAFTILPLFAVVIWMEVRRAIVNSFGGAQSPAFNIQSSLLGVWVTAGGVYLLGLMLTLPYVAELRQHGVFRGILDVRALIVVSLIVPCGVRAAFRVRNVSKPVLIMSWRAPKAQTWFTRVAAGLITPAIRLAHLLYRVVRYIGIVLTEWSKAFAHELRILITDIDAYKAAGQILTVYASYAIIARDAMFFTRALATYLRAEPPWAGGSFVALLSALRVAGALLMLLLLALVVRAVLRETLEEEDVIVAAELLGWGIVSAACSSVILWLSQHYRPLGMVGFAAPGSVALLLGLLVVLYLVKLFRSPANPGDIETA